MGKAYNDRQQRAREAMSAAGAQHAASRRTAWIIGAVVVVVCLAVVAAAVLLRPKATDATAGADASAPTPASVAGADGQYPFAVVPASLDAAKPTLQIWEDFQCPACGMFERSASADALEKAAADGQINLVYRPAAFLDANLRNDSSARAMAAYGCALDAGIGQAYHAAVFDAQPEREGDGYSAAQLKALAADAGLQPSKQASFDGCVDAGTYSAWPANATAAFMASGVPGTPYALLDGVEVPSQVLSDAGKLADVLSGKTPLQGASPSPAAS